MKKRLLADIKLTDADRKRLEPIMRNWLTAHAAMVKQADTWESYEECRRMMFYEVMHGRRYDICKRILGRMQALRGLLLGRELLEYLA